MSILIFRRRHHTVPPFLAFTTQPGGANSGSAFSPQPVVTAKNPDGTTKTSFTGNVTLAVNTVTGSHALGGTVTVAAVAGVATFSGVTDTGSGNGTLTATAAGYSSATSASFTTAAGGGSTIVTAHYTAADGTLIASYTADTGQATVKFGDWSIQSNRATSVGPTNGALAHGWNTGVTDGTASVTIVTLGAGNFPGVAVRMDSACQNYYKVTTDGTTVYFSKVVALAGTTLTSAAQAVVNGDTISLAASGNNFTVKVNGSTVLTWTDSTFPSQTYAGVALYESGTFASVFDDFSFTTP